MMSRRAASRRSLDDGLGLAGGKAHGAALLGWTPPYTARPGPRLGLEVPISSPAPGASFRRRPSARQAAAARRNGARRRTRSPRCGYRCWGRPRGSARGVLRRHAAGFAMARIVRARAARIPIGPGAAPRQQHRSQGTNATLSIARPLPEPTAQRSSAKPKPAAKALGSGTITSGVKASGTGRIVQPPQCRPQQPRSAVNPSKARQKACRMGSRSIRTSWPQASSTTLLAAGIRRARATAEAVSVTRSAIARRHQHRRPDRFREARPPQRRHAFESGAHPADGRLAQRELRRGAHHLERSQVAPGIGRQQVVRRPFRRDPALAARPRDTGGAEPQGVAGPGRPRRPGGRKPGAIAVIGAVSTAASRGAAAASPCSSTAAPMECAKPRYGRGSPCAGRKSSTASRSRP